MPYVTFRTGSMISNAFTEDYRKIDQLLERLVISLKEGILSVEKLNELRKALQVHIYFEETTLFRVVENEGNRSRINGLEVEHAGILRLLDKIESYMTGNDIVRALDRAEGLVRVLRTHNSAEMEHVHTVLDQSENIDRKALLDLFRNATIPEGWQSRVLRRYRH